MEVLRNFHLTLEEILSLIMDPAIIVPPSTETSGQEVPEKRWKKAVNIVDRSIGEALGELYVEQEFYYSSFQNLLDLPEVCLPLLCKFLFSLPFRGSDCFFSYP